MQECIAESSLSGFFSVCFGGWREYLSRVLSANRLWNRKQYVQGISWGPHGNDCVFVGQGEQHWIEGETGSFEGITVDLMEACF